MSNPIFVDLINMHEMDLKIVLKEAIESLEPRQRFVAVRRFYQNQTLGAIAEEIGISDHRVWQIEAKILRLLKRGLSSKRL
jgi:RNA polymerase sporulation-specific sigma factor